MHKVHGISFWFLSLLTVDTMQERERFVRMEEMRKREREGKMANFRGRGRGGMYSLPLRERSPGQLGK